MKIGNLNINVPLFLAPMAGVTDRPFRKICKNMGAGVVYTEFVSANGIIRENRKTLDMIKFTEDERPIGVQIFGEDPEVVGKSAKIIYNKFKPDIIDINYGCPVPKITKKGAGSAALKDLCLMNDITLAVIENVKEVPITVKMRTGWDDNSIVSTEAGIILEKIGVSAITLHPRTTKQQFTGISNWEYIKELKSAVAIPIIGNGDVRTIDDYNMMKDMTNCDGVMIGRAALGNPWIFQDIISNNFNKSQTIVDNSNNFDLCIKHIKLLEEEKGKSICVNLAKKHLGWYLKGFDGATKYRKDIMNCTNIENIYNVLFAIKNNYY